MFCHFCKQETKYNRWCELLRYHIKPIHNIISVSQKEYYDRFLKNDGEGFCLTCNKQVKFSSLQSGYNKFCSPKCQNANEDIKRIQREKRKLYHVKNKEKHKKICLDVWKRRDKKYRQQMVLNGKRTKLEKYGDENYNNKEKISKTWFDKSEDTQNKIIEKQKQIKNNKSIEEKEEIKRKRKQTLLKNHGNENYINVEASRKTKIKNCLKKYKKLCEEHGLLFLGIDEGIKAKCLKCNKDIIIQSHIFHSRIKYNVEICTNCNKIGHHYSDIEKSFLKFIKENYDGNVEENNRKILNRKELDVYLPELKLAFEYNGLYWHNEITKSKNYHLEKTKRCEEKGIHLVHIFEDDWKHKQDIIKSRILNLLKKSYGGFYARECVVEEITGKHVKEFLMNNHLQGYCPSKINLGLFYKNDLMLAGKDLVAVMTFGKLRRNLGYKNSNENEYELLRFCNKLNMTVVGGANKLFKYFIKNFNPKKIISYADRSWTMNNKNSLYDKLGFNFVKETLPNYYYIIDNIRQNRFKYRKSELIKEGFDKNKTEHEIMFEQGKYRIYDSGQLKYEKMI